jgi:diacylglycerol kinase family enzyme
MRLTVLHNEGAGAGAHGDAALDRMLRRAGHVPTIHRPGDAGALARPADAVVVAGGDGTLADLLAPLTRRGLPVGLLPMGSANNVASTLWPGAGAEDLIAEWGARPAGRLALMAVQGPWGRRLVAEGVGIGALAAGMERPHGKHLSGEEKLEAGRAAIGDALRDAAPLTLETDPPLPEPPILVEVLNLPRLGPGLCLAPEQDPAGGALTLISAGEDRRQALRDWIAAPDGPAPDLTVLRADAFDLRVPAGIVRVGDSFERLGASAALRVSRAAESLALL